MVSKTVMVVISKKAEESLRTTSALNPGHQKHALRRDRGKAGRNELLSEDPGQDEAHSSPGHHLSR